MRPALCALALALILQCFDAAGAATRSAAGAGTTSLGDGLKREFEFSAVTNEDGGVTGHLTLNGPAVIPSQDVDGTGEPGADAPPSGLQVTADVDFMRLAGKRAVLGGVVTSTNDPRYSGLRFIFVVEDNGEAGHAAAPDRISWGAYRSVAEWLAADAENPDAGLYPAGGRELDGRRFPPSSYSLFRIESGDIRVTP